MPSLQTLLSPQVLTRVISQQAASSDWLLNLFGVQPGGANELYEGHGREGAFHIYNNTRSVGRLRAPGTSAARSAAQPMGKVMFTYPRMHDSVPLLAERLHNLSLIDNPAIRDAMGADMIRRQTMTLGDKAKNFRKAMLMGMLRDSLYIAGDGDDQYINFSSGIQIPFRMPSGNKLKLNMLGAGDIIATSWDSDSADIPNDLGQINAAFQQLCGGHLSGVLCGQKVWNNVIQNAFVQATHGTASSPFRVLERLALDPSVGSTMLNVYRCVLAVYPDVTWYITDEGLDIGAPGSETFTKIVDDNDAIFLGTSPESGTVACYQGSEPIAEYDGAAKSLKIGLNSWSVSRSNPTSDDIFVLDNSLIVNHVPNSIAKGTVIY